MAEPTWRTGAEFEAFVRDALLLDKDLSPLSDEPFKTSERFERKMARFLADPFGYARRAVRPMWQKVVRAAACAALIAALAVSAAMAINPNFRHWVVEQFRDSTSIFFHGDQTGMGDPTGWRPTKLPDGYTENEVSTLGGTEKVIYKNSDGQKLVFRCSPVADGYMFDFDNEHSVQSTLKMNGQTAHLFDSDTGGRPSALQWFSKDGTLSFSLMGWMPGEDLVSIAKSVKK